MVVDLEHILLNISRTTADRKKIQIQQMFGLIIPLCSFHRNGRKINYKIFSTLFGLKS